MSLIYEIDKSTRIITIQYSSSPTFVEFERTMKAVFEDSNYEAGFNFLLDRSLIDEPQSTDYIRSAIHFFKDHEAKLNCVALVVGNKATYGMGRMAQALANDLDMQFQVFTDLEQAKQWLQYQ